MTVPPDKRARYERAAALLTEAEALMRQLDEVVPDAGLHVAAAQGAVHTPDRRAMPAKRFAITDDEDPPARPRYAERCGIMNLLMGVRSLFLSDFESSNSLGAGSSRASNQSAKGFRLASSGQRNR